MFKCICKENPLIHCIMQYIIRTEITFYMVYCSLCRLVNNNSNDRRLRLRVCEMWEGGGGARWVVVAHGLNVCQAGPQLTQHGTLVLKVNKECGLLTCIFLLSLQK